MLESRLRWRTKRSLLVVLAILLGSCSATEPSEAERALESAKSAVYSSRYRFVDEPEAERLLACSMARRTVRGFVDENLDVMALTVAQFDRPVALVIEGTAYVRREGLAGWATPTEWIQIESEVDAIAAKALRASLGEDLARYVTALSVPDHPSAIVAGALETARSVAFASGSIPNAPELEVVIDPKDLGAGRADENSSQTPLRLQLRLDEFDRVVTLSANLLADSNGDLSMGQRITYDWMPTANEPISRPPADAVTSLALVRPPTNPTPLILDCSIGP